MRIDPDVVSGQASRFSGLAGEVAGVSLASALDGSAPSSPSAALTDAISAVGEFSDAAQMASVGLEWRLEELGFGLFEAVQAYTWADAAVAESFAIRRIPGNQYVV